MNQAASTSILMSPRVRPGLRYGNRPMKAVPVADFSDRFIRRLDARLGSLWDRWQLRQNSFAAFVPTYQEISKRVARYSDLTDDEFEQRLGESRHRANKLFSLDQIQDDFALCIVACERTIGLRPHPEQVFAAWNMQNGVAIEMQTGEGKSLVAALTAATVARTGTRVHVISVNDYLVERDCQVFAPMFKLLNLSTAASLGRDDENARRHAYACDITYVTAKQLAFDYLRDQMQGPRGGGVAERLESLTGDAQSALTMLTGLSFAIVDELDNIMIDDARTPMILATARDDVKQSDNRAEMSVAIGLARELHEDVDFRIQRKSGGIWLTDQGQSHLAELGEQFKGVWQFKRYRSERVRQALHCLHILKRDHDYVVRDGRIELVDQSTGRIMSDRRLQNGLHSFLEVLEKCELTTDTATEISTSFQSFFQCFHVICGMSGTLRETRGELSSSYGLQVLEVPSHSDNRRKYIGNEMVVDQDAFAVAIIQRVKQYHATGRPLLLATASIEQSRWVSSLLVEHKLDHQVLDAVQDGDEAEIVSLAGRAFAITVATNMAGRGTDIPLDDEAGAAGGLHVILLAVNDSKRTDRQIYGRAARQGDPGSTECLLSLDDALLSEEFHPWLKSLIRAIFKRSDVLGSCAGLFSVSLLKISLVRRHVRLRKAVMREHGRLQRMLAFGESN